MVMQGMKSYGWNILPDLVRMRCGVLDGGLSAFPASRGQVIHIALVEYDAGTFAWKADRRRTRFNAETTNIVRF